MSIEGLLNKIHNVDCLEFMKSMPDNCVDSIVTDPPYGLSFMGKKWDYDVPSVEIWKEALRVLKPGGYLLSFAGTRTQHRMAVNIEDAGFEIRDMIAWVYGSGFPKSHNIGKSVDKLQGNEREVIGDNPNHRKLQETNTMVGEPHSGDGTLTKGNSPYEGWGTALKPSVESITVAQKRLDSSSDIMIKLVYTIKEALCQLPSFVETAEIVLKSNLQEQNEDVNTAQWIAEKNINTQEDLFVLMDMLLLESEKYSSWNIVSSWLNTLEEICRLTNIATISTELSTITELKILLSMEWVSIFQNIMQVKNNQISGSSVNVWDVESIFSVLKVKLKDIQEHFAQECAMSKANNEGLLPNLEPITVARKPFKGTVAENVLKYGTGGINIDGCRVGTDEMTSGGSIPDIRSNNYENSSGKDRLKTEIILKQGRFPANFIHDGSEEVVGLFPDSKSTTGKRGGQGFHNAFGRPDRTRNDGQEVSGHNDSGSASCFFYCAKSSKQDRNEGCENIEGGNRHCTVKPTKLMQYLVRLVTPKEGIVLDPFTGSGSTGKACMLEGFNFIGIERDEEYCKIAEARIRLYNQQLRLF